ESKMVLLLQASDEGWPREGAILPLFSSGNAAQSALKFRVVCSVPPQPKLASLRFEVVRMFNRYIHFERQSIIKK
ncbi:MAG: hypothetical protein J0L97_07725, partial [Alphaproteobacteria bacterium]|nr:hypothetical protein [Alphaproteobacteria bacterium]